MDLAMPRMGERSAIEQIRGWSLVPIIVLSVMGGEPDKVRALEAGADDYLTKPFGIQELNARIRVALRHAKGEPAESMLQFGDVRLDIERRQVTVGGQEVHLTPNEYSILRQLALSEGRVLTHRTLLASVWGDEYKEQVQYLWPVITSLRKKLGSGIINTEPGVGYRLRVILP